MHKILNRQDCHWTKKTLETLEKKDLGWSKNIKNILEKYNLPTDFKAIKDTPPLEWKRKTNSAIEKINTEKLLQQCHKTTGDRKDPKTKTATIVQDIEKSPYLRQPNPEVLKSTKQETKTLIIARYGMLECGKNFKGKLNEICDLCKTLDDENHRINYCMKWRDINFVESTDKKVFNLIYSNDIVHIKEILPVIEQVWDTKNAHATMNV